MSALRSALHLQEDNVHKFWSLGFTDDRHRFFTDGPCLQHEVSEFTLAAWSVVNARTGTVLASGPLVGLEQTTPCRSG